MALQRAMLEATNRIKIYEQNYLWLKLPMNKNIFRVDEIVQKPRFSGAKLLLEASCGTFLFWVVTITFDTVFSHSNIAPTKSVHYDHSQRHL